MICENVQELISSLLDGRLSPEERENVLAHTGVCRECGTRLEALQTQRALLRKMAHAPVPKRLATTLRVIASHERERQLARISVRERVRRLVANVNLAFDNQMRPMALPFTGGLLSTLLVFGLLVPTLFLSRQTSGRQFTIASAVDDDVAAFESTPPTGRIVTNPYNQVADGDEDHPRIEPIDSQQDDFLNIVDLTIDETGKIVDWTVVRGEVTPDMKSVIMFSRFEPATNMGIATSGRIRMVQSSALSVTVRG